MDSRKLALSKLLDRIGDGLVVCGLGKMGRELFELRQERGEPNDDFIAMGSMGCAVGIGLGIALSRPSKKVFVLTGDGALLMKLGSIATALRYKPENLEIIVIENDLHDSTGGQRNNFEYISDWVGTHCRVIKVKPGANENLGRPNITPKQMVERFRGKILN